MPDPSETLAPATATSTIAATTSTSTSLGFETPANVDVAYVQRVLDEIYRLEGEAARHLYANKVPDAEFNQRLEAILGEPALESAKALFGREAAAGLPTLADPPGNPKARVLSIVAHTEVCIAARVFLDYRPLFRSGERTEPNGLVQLSPGDIVPFNTTGWGIVAAGVPVPNQDPSKKAC